MNNSDRYEMRWHSEINNQSKPRCVQLCNTTNMEIKCGRTLLPTQSGMADVGDHIKWIPSEGYSLSGPNSSVCQEDGTWSNDVPCCK